MVDVETIAKLSLGPGDILVLKSKNNLNREAMKRLQLEMEQILEAAGHPDQRTMVLTPEFSLEVVKPSTDELARRVDAQLKTMADRVPQIVADAMRRTSQWPARHF